MRNRARQTASVTDRVIAHWIEAAGLDWSRSRLESRVGFVACALTTHPLTRSDRPEPTGR